VAENKTQENDQSVQAFLEGVEDERKRADSLALVQLLQEVTGEPPRMWGSAIVGFGKYHYRYDSGREGDSMMVGFSPRKQNLTLYVSDLDKLDELLNRLGKHKTGKGCLYINRLADVDTSVLRELVQHSYEQRRANHAE
jgi:hypothetical protein